MLLYNTLKRKKTNEHPLQVSYLQSVQEEHQIRSVTFLQSAIASHNCIMHSHFCIFELSKCNGLKFLS